ncbi:ATP-binding protein [Pseudomonas syringae]|uniref:DNA-binding domain-containing protein n=1 Tax=Pseudomonas syringae TaxID=317 RepID=A0AB38BZM7_PSESX|nr:ATP-binding protein [Pseudomonas syringae]MCK0549327.1 ATP-binding protein [Pseudomonas syringae pv. aptata]SFO44360.1 Putative DNA-binding domain-containing protein [Pseudomonas syringae]SFO79427.1 Putative DNA-binding domain-containing protein [Pseudomonas syringae]
MEISDDWIEMFFSAVDDNLILKRRESSTVEFKKIFDWTNKEFKSNIGRTSAALANRDGGVIVFGVADQPHCLIGIDNFEQVDDADLAAFFNEHFAPSIEFIRHIVKSNGVTLGILQILPARLKPIVCIKDSAKTFDSDIYYRYSGRSSKIKSADLFILIQEERDAAQKKWVDLITNAVKIGVENIGLLNVASGELQSANNNTFLIDESILDKIKILDKFSEHDSGAPAVRVIGDVVDAARVIERARNIHEEDVYLAFLTEILNAPGLDYISAMLRMTSEYYPIYFFLDAANIQTPKRIETVDRIVSRFKVKQKILYRIANDQLLEGKRKSYPVSNTPLGTQRGLYLEKYRTGVNLEIETESQCKAALEAIFSLDTQGFDRAFVKSEILSIYNRFYPFSLDSTNYLFRWAITYLDKILA